MAKILYAYFNDKDLDEFLSFLGSRNILVSSQSGMPLSEVPAISTDLLTLQIPVGETNAITITMCSYSGYYLQNGTIYYDDKANPEAKHVFNDIRKYIRGKYRLSKDKKYYIGPYIYEDWLQDKHNFPVLFDYDEIIVIDQNIEGVFIAAINCGFAICANDVRLRSINEWSINDESLIICTDVSKLHRSIIRRSFVHYSYGSDCIFIYKDAKQKQYRLILDKRIDTIEQGKLTGFFEDIQLQYGKRPSTI